MTTTHPTLATRLQRVLDERGCSIAEAARLANLQHMQVYRIARGTNPNPTVKTLEAIVTAIGSTMGELFRDD